MSEPSFPPLLSGLAVSGAIDPYEKACANAALGCDAGLIVHNIDANNFRAAIVMAPEVALKDAVTMLAACGISFQNALGALAPPEVAVHLEWDGGIRINGAACGKLRLASSSSLPDKIPDWLVIGLELPLWPASDDPGKTPDQTALYAEGCTDVNAIALLESWARHTLVWVNRWDDEGVRPLHAEWRGLAHNVGETVTMHGLTGQFLGVDERFGMLLRDENETHLIPLTRLLDTH